MDDFNFRGGEPMTRHKLGITLLILIVGGGLGERRDDGRGERVDGGGNRHVPLIEEGANGPGSGLHAGESSRSHGGGNRRGRARTRSPARPPHTEG